MRRSGDGDGLRGANSRTTKRGATGGPISHKSFQSMNRASSGIKAVLETLDNQLRRLDAEIKADEAGKLTFERMLAQLEKQKEELQARVDANLHWAASYETDIGPFEQIYVNNTKEIKELYGKAKAKHKAGVEVLKKEFNYHPEFKRPQDTFSATPFVPK